MDLNIPSRSFCIGCTARVHERWVKGYHLHESGHEQLKVLRDLPFSVAPFAAGVDIRIPDRSDEVDQWPRWKRIAFWKHNLDFVHLLLLLRIPHASSCGYSDDESN